MGRSLTAFNQFGFHLEIRHNFGLRLGRVDAKVKKIDQVAFVNHTATATCRVQRLLHAGHNVITGFFLLVIFFGDFVLADLFQQLFVLVDQEVHFTHGTVNGVLRVLGMRVDFHNLNLKHFTVKFVCDVRQLCLFAAQFHLLFAEVDVRLLQRHLGSLNLGQRVLDGADRRDSRYVQRHLHKLRVRLMEVAGVLHDRRHPVLNVFQHQVVFRFSNRQVRVGRVSNQIH